MKRTGFNPLESMVNLGKSIGKSIKKAKRGILTTAAAFVLPYMFTSNAEAVEGSVYFDFNVGDMGGSSFVLGHGPGGTPGLDPDDIRFTPIPNPDGWYFSSTVNIEGTEVVGESESSYGEPAGTTVSNKLVVIPGKSLTISSSKNLSSDSSYKGYNGYKVIVSGTSGALPAGTYTGETLLDSTSISFERDLYDPNGNTYVKDVGNTGFTAGVTITDDGWGYGDELCNAEIYYMPVGETEWTLAGQQTGLSQGEKFEVPISGLEQNKEYFVTSYVYNSKKEKYCDIEKLTTTYIINTPTVSTKDARNITKDSAGLLALLENDGDQTTNSAQTSFVYFTNGGTQISTPWQTTAEGATFSASLSGLDPNTIYMYFARAKNSEKTGTGTTKNFRTLEAPIDANSCPVVISKDKPWLVIQNFISQFRTDPNKPHKNQGNFTYIENKGNLETIDSNDVPFTGSSALASQIYSKVMEFTQDPQDANTTIINVHDLSTQANPQNPKKDMLISMTVTGDPNEIINSANYLRLWANDPNSEDPNHITTSFAGPLTLQQFDPNMLNINNDDPNAIWDVYDPNTTHVTNTKYPVRDAKKYINKKQDIQLDNLTTSNDPNEIADPNSTKTIKLNSPYTYFAMSRTGEVADIDGSGKVDANDLDAFAPYLQTGSSGRGDVYSVKDKEIGMTDGITGNEDGEAVAVEVYRMDPNFPVNARYGLNEDFDDQKFAIWMKNDAAHPWTIDTKYSTSGGFSARSGVIGDSATSGLEFNVNLENPGNLNFNLKTSCKSGFDFAKLYIDGVYQGRWSGATGFQNKKYGLSKGAHNIKFTYETNSAGHGGENAVWLDNVEVIPNEYIGAN
jgi:hypothetical protein